MHSTIFKVQMVPEGEDPPAIEGNSLSEEEYFSYDICLTGKKFFDYVDSAVDVMDEARWLGDTIPVEVNTEKKTAVIKVTKEMKRNFFEERYAAFLEQVKTPSLEQFMDDWKIYELERAIDTNCYGFHIHEDGIDMSLDKFLRNSSEGEYAITGALDYHF